MPDNWSYVAAAYGLTALVLALYWRRLVRKENELRARTRTATTTPTAAERQRDPAAPGPRQS